MARRNGAPLMPYHMIQETPAQARIDLTPNRSLGPRGFVWFIALTAGFLLLPLIAVLGTIVLWGLLPFMGAALWGVWYALARNNADQARLREELTLSRERVHLTRHQPRGHPLTWEANPYWVRLNLLDKGGPVENYLTLSGGGREVELGAFLSPEERAQLHDDLTRALARLR